MRGVVKWDQTIKKNFSTSRYIFRSCSWTWTQPFFNRECFFGNFFIRDHFSGDLFSWGLFPRNLISGDLFPETIFPKIFSLGTFYPETFFPRDLFSENFLSGDFFSTGLFFGDVFSAYQKTCTKNLDLPHEKNGIWIIYGSTGKITVCSSIFYGVDSNFCCRHGKN